MARQKSGVSNRHCASKGKTSTRYLIWIAAVTGVAAAATVFIELRRVPEVFPSGELRASGTVPTTTGESWDDIDDPAKDGWDSEVFHGKAKKQLSILGKLMAHPEDIDASRLTVLVTEDVSCGNLFPADLDTVFEDEVLLVQRDGVASEPPGADLGSSSQTHHRGIVDLVEALRAVARPFNRAKDIRFEFKVFRVELLENDVWTRQYFAISGRTAEGMVEQHATWRIGWAPGADGSPPRIRSIMREDFEQTTSLQTRGGFFVDCTDSVLGGDTSYRSQILRGYNYWLDRMQDPRYFSMLGTPGIAMGDVNGDGLEDLYVCQAAGLPNRLYIQRANGQARDESEARGVNWLESSRSALLVDLDNDGDQDLVVAMLGGLAVSENDGQGRFQLRDVLATTEDTMSTSAVDYDHDGRLDLYVCVYHPNRDPVGGGASEPAALPGAGRNVVLHDDNNAGNNSLFRNEISADLDWRFTDVTNDVGLGENNQRWSLAASWEDFDNDGDQDLYVANDYGRDNLYRNELAATGDAHFVDIAEIAHAEDAALGMSITWGDFDHNGWMDAHVSNMFSFAGNRIAFRPKFRSEGIPETRKRLQRLTRGNTLLKNQGNGTFHDVSGSAGIEMGRWAWGSHFFDLNNDGWEDLIVSNGYITTEDTGDL